MKSIIKGFFMVVAVLIIIVGVIIAVAWITQIVWNAVMPDVFGLPIITFWQALLLQILSWLLIKSSPSLNNEKKKE